MSRACPPARSGLRERTELVTNEFYSLGAIARRASPALSVLRSRPDLSGFATHSPLSSNAVYLTFQFGVSTRCIPDHERVEHKPFGPHVPCNRIKVRVVALDGSPAHRSTPPCGRTVRDRRFRSDRAGGSAPSTRRLKSSKARGLLGTRGANHRRHYHSGSTPTTIGLIFSQFSSTSTI